MLDGFPSPVWVGLGYALRAGLGWVGSGRVEWSDVESSGFGKGGGG